MKSIILFHRLELADLFVPVGKALEGKVRIIHLAYSRKEVERLRELGVSGPITVFKDEVKRLHPTSVTDNATLLEIDSLFIKQSGGAFNLNSAIQSDRGFSLLRLDEAHKITVTYHRFWSNFLDKHDTNIVLHETCSLMFNFVAAMHCTGRGGAYLYFIMAQGPDKNFYHLLMSGFDFTCRNIERALSAVDAGKIIVSTVQCGTFLENYRKNFEVFLGGSFKRPSLVRLAAQALLKGGLALFRRNTYDRVVDNIDYWQVERRIAAVTLRNILRYRKEIEFDKFDPAQRFYFYPIHLEPEAVVLYHAHGLYTNQVKLIQNIAAQLPPGVFLYVKDHPHGFGYRSADDYLALKSVPNIRLLETSISGKEVTAHSLGVITITGTAGFEAMLLGKQVFTFGKTFYSTGPGVIYLQNIRDLREAIYSGFSRSPTTDAALHRFLTAYFNALNSGMTDYFAGRAQQYGIDLDLNAEKVATGLLATLQAMD